jgi:guanine deaminase
MDHERWMKVAIEQARAGIAAGQSPFGAVVVRGDRAVGTGHNEVWLRTDITAHAEVVAVQRACATLKSIDLSGCAMYTTCEPCPMCASAIHWARIGACVFGATIADASGAGFNELQLAARDVYRIGGSGVDLVGGVMQGECAALFGEWKRVAGRVY